MSTPTVAPAPSRPRVARAARRAPLPLPAVTWHRIRKAIHVFCFAVFVTLPFLDVMRFDIPRERFYFFGHELWINEFGILFYTLMLLMFVIAAVSMLYGRMYCSYMCPQMIFSEASLSLERWLQRMVARRFAGWSASVRSWIARAAFLAIVAAASVFLAFVFIAYFVEPRDLLGRLRSFDVVTAGGVAGAATTLVTFLDFAFVQQRFCTSICPYGYLQGMLSDDRTLLVQYRDESHACIECRKCVRVCHMGIDIRTSPHQIECIHCGECIDACVDVLHRIGQPGLIHYAWGERGREIGVAGESWYARIGLRDAKRVVLLLVLLFFASGLAAALSLREPVLVRLAPDRERLYSIGSQGEIINRFRITLANRGSEPAAVDVRLEGLEQADLRLELPIPVAPGDTVQKTFEVAVPADGPRPASGVTPIVFVVRPAGGREDRIDMTFITPTTARGDR